MVDSCRIEPSTWHIELKVEVPTIISYTLRSIHILNISHGMEAKHLLLYNI